jgi:hypothetical protein
MSTAILMSPRQVQRYHVAVMANEPPADNCHHIHDTGLGIYCVVDTTQPNRRRIKKIKIAGVFISTDAR